MNNDSNHYKFTGKERDGETGLDYFGARYYSNSLGRFLTPDWAESPEPIPYANLLDPQSINQYGYVRDLPTAKVDADGHDAIWLVDQKTGQATLVIPVNITGTAATPETVSAIINRDNSLDTGDSPVKLQVIQTDQPINGVLNHLDFSPGSDKNLCPDAGECVNALGGNNGHINSDNADSISAAAHDILHFAGIEDQYVEDPRDAGGNRVSHPKPGYDNSNIMTARAGTQLKAAQIQEAKKNKTTKRAHKLKPKPKPPVPPKPPDAPKTPNQQWTGS